MTAEVYFADLLVVVKSIFLIKRVYTLSISNALGKFKLQSLEVSCTRKRVHKVFILILFDTQELTSSTSSLEKHFLRLN